MKIEFTDQELIRLGLKESSVPSLVDDEFSIIIDSNGVQNDKVAEHDKTKGATNLSLATLNESRNSLIGSLHPVAFNGSYTSLIDVPTVANSPAKTKGYLLSAEDCNRIFNIDIDLGQKANVHHTHQYTDITNFPDASKTERGLMTTEQCAILNSLKDVATTGLYEDLIGKPPLATEDEDGFLSAEMFMDIKKISDMFGTIFQKINGEYVYNHTHDKEDFSWIKDEMMKSKIDIDNLQRTTEGYANIHAGYDDKGNLYSGLMRGEDKQKLDKIDTKANYYIHPETHSASMIDGLSKVAITGSYYDLDGLPDTMAIINSIDPKNGIAIGSTGGLQIRKDGLARISFQRGIQYFHDKNLSTKASIQIDDDKGCLDYILNGTAMNIRNENKNMINLIPTINSFANCELELTGNISFKHSQDPEATGYNGIVLGTDVNRNNGKVYGEHSIGFIGDHTIGFGTKNSGTEHYTAFINTRTGDFFSQGSIYVKGEVEETYKDETLSPSLGEQSEMKVTRSIPEMAENLGVSIKSDSRGCIDMSSTILALLDKIEELTDTIERHEIRLRQMEKELY